MAFEWGSLTSPEDVEPELLAAVRSHLPTRAGSVALVDWTALEHACVLMEQSLWAEPTQDAQPLTFGGAIPPQPERPGRLRHDPFLALADLASVVSALVLHDTVLILGFRGHELAERATALFGLPPGIIRDLPVRLSCDAGADDGAQARTDTLQSVLGSVWFWARQRFNYAQRESEPWYAGLRENWERLIPGVAFPSHDDGSLQAILGDVYVPSPTRSDVPALFSLDEFAWRQLRGTLDRLIVDNDMRSLFYEGLAVQLQQLYETADGCPTIRYVGGCLRGPLQMAYGQSSPLARESVGLERWVQTWWRALAEKLPEPIVLPIWFDAVLASGARDPSEVAERVRAWRERARSFRANRAALEAHLAQGDAVTAREVQRALAADLGDMSKAVGDLASESVKAGLGVATAVHLLAVAPPAAGLAAAGVKVAAQRSGVSAWLRLRWLRIRQPHLWVIAEMSRESLAALRPLDAATRAFGFPQDIADEVPAGFIPGSHTPPGPSDRSCRTRPHLVSKRSRARQQTCRSSPVSTIPAAVSRYRARGSAGAGGEGTTGLLARSCPDVPMGGERLLEPHDDSAVGGDPHPNRRSGLETAAHGRSRSRRGAEVADDISRPCRSPRTLTVG